MQAVTTLISLYFIFAKFIYDLCSVFYPDDKFVNCKDSLKSLYGKHIIVGMYGYD